MVFVLMGCVKIELKLLPSFRALQFRALHRTLRLAFPIIFGLSRIAVKHLVAETRPRRDRHARRR
jgi:hypothetical protein